MRLYDLAVIRVACTFPLLIIWRGNMINIGLQEDTLDPDDRRTC
jgi:hypothetical protein